MEGHQTSHSLLNLCLLALYLCWFQGSLVNSQSSNVFSSDVVPDSLTTRSISTHPTISATSEAIYNWCEEELYTLPSNPSVEILFNRTEVGNTFQTSFTCDTGPPEIREVTRQCTLENGGRSEWQSPQYESCESTEEVNQAIQELSEFNATEENVEEIAKDIANLTEDSGGLHAQDIDNVASILIDVISVVSEADNITNEILEEVSEQVLTAVDNLLEIPEQEYQESENGVSSDILDSIDALLTLVQGSSGGDFTFSGSNIVLAAVKVESTSFPLSAGISASSLSEDDEFSFATNSTGPERFYNLTSVYLPESIVDLIPGTTENISVSVYVVDSDKLFQTSSDQAILPTTNADDTVTTVVASPVISVTIEGANITNLKDPVVFSFPLDQNLLAQHADNASLETTCVYWDTENTGLNGGVWSPEGCEKASASTEEFVLCNCNHLTSFAVLMDIKGDVSSKALDIITKIGCIASIICLVLTIGFLLGIKKLRERQSQQILVNLSLALLGLYAVFVIAIDRPSWGLGCATAAILIHFFCLASVTWMGVEAFNMYNMFVKVINTYTPNLLLKCCLVGWGVPAGIVVISAGANWTDYRNPAYCFVKPGPSLFYGLLLPIGIILSANVIVYVVVVYKLTCGRMKVSKSVTSSKTASQKEDAARIRAEAIRRVQNAVIIGSLLGITWLFGFLAVGRGRLFFSILFTLFNSMQGVLIFALFVVRQPEVRKEVSRRKSSLLDSLSGRAGVTLVSNSSRPSLSSEMNLQVINRGSPNISIDFDKDVGEQSKV